MGDRVGVANRVADRGRVRGADLGNRQNRGELDVDSVIVGDLRNVLAIEISAVDCGDVDQRISGIDRNGVVDRVDPGLTTIKKALVVDDVSDTGASLREAKVHVESQRASQVRVATLHVKPWTTLKPDYYAAETDTWIVYPWDPIECMISIAARFENDGLKSHEIRKRLTELGFEPKVVNRLP